MRKLSKIDESSWGEMRRRSSGEQIRKEDDVDIKSPEEFFDYLRSHYRINNSAWDITNNEDSLTLCIPFCGIHVEDVYHIFCLFFDYEDDVVYIHNNHQKFTPNLWNKLNKHYDLWKDEPDYDGYTIINPLDTSRPVNNSYVLEVLNFVMSNMDSNATPCIFKKTNESTWGDMRKRSSGNQIRKEDDVNNLDCEGLTDYLKKHYKPLNSFAIITNVVNIISMPIIKITTHHCIMYSPKSKFGKICITNEIIDSVDGLLEKLNTHFEIKEEYGEDTNGEYTFYYVSPKDGSDVTNKFFIEVLDFLLDNIPNSPNYKKSFEKRS